MRTRLVAVGAMAGTLLLAACAGVQKDEEATTTTEAAGASLTITSPTAGTSVGGNVVSLDVEASGLEIVKADGDRSGNTGHYHVFIDKDPVAAGETIPREAGIVHSTDDPMILSGLPIGSHRLVVVFGDGTHARIGDASAETTVDVKGPSIDATAPATATVGQAVKVETKVDGFSLIKADGDRSAKTGHLHVFVDRAPTAAGQPIPLEAGIIHSAAPSIEVPGLAAGEHTLWVVAGDGTHVPFEPRVMDKVTVTVS